MTGMLVIAHAVLWTGLIVLLVIVYALTRQIGVLFERIALGVGLTARRHVESLLEVERTGVASAPELVAQNTVAQSEVDNGAGTVTTGLRETGAPRRRAGTPQRTRTSESNQEGENHG